MPRFSTLRLLLGCLLSSIATPAFADHVAPAPPCAPGVIFAVDGSGCLRDMSPALSDAVSQACLPLRVIPFHWSHGPGRVFADLRNQGHHRAKGQELAAAITAQRTANPNGKVYLVCHSSGAALAMAASECLPPGSIDRIILLAPATSYVYDVRPALAASCQGVDVFYSRKDVIAHGLALTGTTDGRHLFSAGAGGYSLTSCCHPNLRQHPWEMSMSRTGHFGGHFGCTQAAFLRSYVVPLLGCQ